MLTDGKKFYPCFPMKYLELKDDKNFEENLQTLLFFRYILGYDSNSTNIWVLFDGTRYYPVSHIFTKQVISPYTLNYKITKLKVQNTKTIDPRIQLRKILNCPFGNLYRSTFEEFITNIEKTIESIDPRHLDIVPEIRDKLLNLINNNFNFH